MTLEQLQRGYHAHQQAFELSQALLPQLLRMIQAASACLDQGGKILICGNGGSASDAQHIAAELSGRYVKERPGLMGIALTTDTSVLTAVGNDYGFDHIFARQVEALGRKGDLLLGISTSGNSANVIKALQCAQKQGLDCWGFSGKEGGVMQELLAEQNLVVPVQETARIQEMHILLGHLLCEGIDSKY